MSSAVANSFSIGYERSTNANLTGMAAPSTLPAPRMVSLTFVGLLLYVTLEYLRPEVVFQGITAVPIFFLVSAILGVSFIVGQAFAPQHQPRAPQHLFMAAFLVVIPISLLLSPAKDSVWNARFGFLEFGKIALMFFVCVSTINSRARLTFLIGFLQVLTLYLAIGGILTVVYGPVLPGFGIETSGRLRYSGIFDDSNDFAQLLLVGGALILNRVLRIGGRFSRTFWTLGFLTVATAIALTASRGGLLGLVVVIAAALARARGTFQALVLSAVVVVGLGAAMPNLALERFRGTTTEEGSAHGRIAAWTEGWSMFWSNPVTGVGFNQFREYAGITAHNSLVLVSSETGLVGIYCWIGLFYMTFRMASQLRGLIGRGHLDYCLNATHDALIAFLSTAWFLSRAYMFLPYLLVALALSAVFVATKEHGLPLTKYSGLGMSDLGRITVVVLGWLVVWKLNLVAGWSL